MRTKYRSARQAGFTLVELLIVVIILGILAAIVLPQFASTTDDAKIGALDTNLSTLRSSIELYYQQHGAYPSAVGDGTNAANSTAAFISQLTQYSSAAGGVSASKTGSFVYGPYLKKATLPVEPMSGLNTLVISTAGTLGMTADGAATGGWKFDNKTGQLIANMTAHQGR